MTEPWEKWYTAPADLEVKPRSKLLNAIYYPVPNIKNETFYKELEHLVEIGVLTPAQQLQYGTPVFIIPKNQGTVRFITDYRKLNQKIVRKPYPFPRIGVTMQQLEGFQYATALYVNIGYDNIELSPESCNITTTVAEFGKFSYNRFRMGLCASSDTFQFKVDDLLWDIKGPRHISTIY